MIKAQITLYAILIDNRIDRLEILSNHPDRYEPCYAYARTDLDFHSQIYNIFSKYFEMDYSYVNFISIEPFVEDDTLILPVYCLIPYNVTLKEGYFISPTHAYNSPAIRKILNII
jgi:hypothetical protein